MFVFGMHEIESVSLLLLRRVTIDERQVDSLFLFKVKFKDCAELQNEPLNAALDQRPLSSLGMRQCLNGSFDPLNIIANELMVDLHRAGGIAMTLEQLSRQRIEMTLFTRRMGQQIMFEEVDESPNAREPRSVRDQSVGAGVESLKEFLMMIVNGVRDSAHR
jgi:hypothetical protein